MKNILITGGLGYLGGRMAKYFSDNGYSVLITTRKSENDFPGNIPVNISFIFQQFMFMEEILRERSLRQQGQFLFTLLQKLI